MGLSIRVFLVEDDDSINRLPLAKYERLLRRSSDERLLKYAGKQVRYALIVVDLVNRKPIEIVRDQFGFLDFDDEGRLKIAEHEKKESEAFEMLAPILSEQRNSRIIDARHKFAQKSYLDKFSWTPTDEIIAAIGKEIFYV